jgi:hypothetical protein
MSPVSLEKRCLLRPVYSLAVRTAGRDTTDLEGCN